MAVKAAATAAAPSSRVPQELDLQQEVESLTDLREDQVKIINVLQDIS